jgi:hypothetical protein
MLIISRLPALIKEGNMLPQSDTTLLVRTDFSDPTHPVSGTMATNRTS